MPSRRKRFRDAADAGAEARRRGVEEGVERVLRTLRALQGEVRLTLEGLPSDFDAAFLPELEREIARQIARWGTAAEDTAGSVWVDAARRGGELLDDALLAADIRVGAWVISDGLVRSLAEHSVDLIQGLGADARSRILDSVSRGVLGGSTPHQVMVEIGEQLSDPGPFRTVGFRAETIMRTETGRIHSVAGERRLEAAAEDLPDLGGEWLWSGKGRMAHSAVNGQKRALGKPFLVAGEEMLYPRQPGTSAANTINCGCEKIPWLARWDT